MNNQTQKNKWNKNRLKRHCNLSRLTMINCGTMTLTFKLRICWLSLRNSSLLLSITTKISKRENDMWNSMSHSAFSSLKPTQTSIKSTKTCHLSPQTRMNQSLTIKRSLPNSGALVMPPYPNSQALKAPPPSKKSVSSSNKPRSSKKNLKKSWKTSRSSKEEPCKKRVTGWS